MNKFYIGLHDLSRDEVIQELQSIVDDPALGHLHGQARPALVDIQKANGREVMRSDLDIVERAREWKQAHPG